MLVLRLAAAVVVLAGVAHVIGGDRLARAFAAMDLRWFGAAVLVAAAAQFASALRWAAIARGLGLQAPNRPLVIAYAHGVAANALLPGATLGGDALRSLRLQRLGNPVGRSTLSVLIDRLSGLWILCAMSVVALAAWIAWAGWPAAVDAGVASPAGPDMSKLAPRAWIGPYAGALLAILVVPWLPWHVPAAASALSRLHGALARIHHVALSARHALTRSLPASIAVQALSAGALWLCVGACGGVASYAAVLAIAAPVFVAAALPISIGGFGPREAAALLAFPLIGVPSGIGVAAAALYGAAALVLGLAASPLLAWSFAGRSGRDP
ncbi:MAG TPA: lysylphosphatidylglycerol synthase transmembrane domain-containing protein [Burkholderiaceae bacterium]|nr:lysylphosphatidylglycerol synthase transmembrane domain-containing protein [Burkholderiaceae bacterium]